MRKKFIAANWKMNKTNEQAEEFLTGFLALQKSKGLDADIIVCAPFTTLGTATKILKDRCIKVGAQNMHFETSGAYTGEISAEMLAELGVQCVIVGHSERRQYFGETDTAVNKKVLTALKNEIQPILCVGETLAERESGLTEKVVKTQTVAALQNVPENDIEKIVLAYEPVWAIGTGKTATASEANNVIRYIRSILAELYGKPAAEKIRILYGGSMNGKNAGELLSETDIDGGLIGGASLKPQDFFDIIKCV